MNISRLTCSGIIAFFCTSVLFPSYSNAGERDSSSGRDKPNIIVFFLDDSGYADYAHNGNPTIRTPNISKLVQDRWVGARKLVHCE